MATLTRVQHNTANGSTTAASLTATLGSGVTSGNLLVATIVTGFNVGTITPPAGWAQAGPTETAGTSLQTQIFYLVVGTGGATSFAFSWTGTHSFGWTIDEWNSSSGWQASPVDSSAGAVHTTASAAVSCGSPSATAQASELWYGVLSWVGSGQTLSSITSGWTTGDTSAFSGQNTQTGFYQIATATGTPTLAATISTAEINAGVVATFLPVAGTSAPAGLATATATAQQPYIQATGLATATATAQQPQARGMSPATATATAYNATVLTGTTAPAGLATATATAQQPQARGMSPATATGTAQQPSVQVQPSGGLATATATARQPYIQAVGAARATGTAYNAAARVLRSPENLGAVLSLPSPNGAVTEELFGAACASPDYGATLSLASFGASLTGWTMQTAPLNLSEFNDVTVDIAITLNGTPYNLAGVTVNLLLKTQAGTPDANALVFSSAGGSPAITITNTSGGLAVAVIPNTDLDSETYNFYRLDVVNPGPLTNTCLYGPVTWTTL